MNTFPIHSTFTTRESEPIVSFRGSAGRLMVPGNNTCGGFALFGSTDTRGADKAATEHGIEILGPEPAVHGDEWWSRRAGPATLTRKGAGR
jgi:hypothetical protein